MLLNIFYWETLTEEVGPTTDILKCNDGQLGLPPCIKSYKKKKKNAMYL